MLLTIILKVQEHIAVIFNYLHENNDCRYNKYTHNWLGIANCYQQGVEQTGIWEIFNGLKKHGYEKEADNLREKTIQLIQKSGFREFFNPFSGEGYGAVDFSWSTLVVDMILR